MALGGEQRTHVTKRFIALALASLSITGLVSLGSAAQATVNPQQAGAARSTARHAQAAGAFVALVVFATLVTRNVGNAKCEFRVKGTLTFSGTLDGVASGTTTALIDAPCPEALSDPPGTYRDVFRFEGSFAGTVAGVPAQGSLSYAGVTRPGGSIDANIRLRAEDTKADLRIDDASLGRGGTYHGVVVTNA